MQYAEVLLPVALDTTFTYSLSDMEKAVVGQRVLVEFGNSGQLVGLIVNICEDKPESSYEIKPIISVLDDFPIVNSAWWSLMRFSARYYVEPLGKALRNAFPKRLRDIAPLVRPVDTYFSLTEEGKIALLKKQIPKNAIRQYRLLNALYNNNDGKEKALTLELLRALGCNKKDCDTALAKGYITTKELSPYEDNRAIKTANYPLNDEQQQVVNDILATSESFTGHLIDGVTGSGKTEIYITLIEKAIADGGQVLLLVPEIALTPQMLARFTGRFGKRVATYHSGMTDIQRRDVFISAVLGDLPILIGTRSAIFVPMKSLKLILIDEEHDLSYKQQEGFLYNARDLALYRAKQERINVVMGSATPSLESLYNVSLGKLLIHYLTKRATSTELPHIHIVDRRGHSREQVLTDKIISQMRQTLQRGEQVLLFLNRRGYSPVMGCANCDWRSDCPACSVFQTAHIQTRQLCCHHCGYSEKLPIYCPKCGDSEIYFMGVGTEKIEQQLNQQFPQHNILRLDRDKQTTSKQLDEALEKIHRGDVDIIIGTQLVVKGHHFPQVTMVCVVDADSALFSSDFRAEERLYQQLIQVAGRAGREQKGQVYVQSSLPEHPVFHALLRHNYQDYAQTLLQERKNFSLPPYTATAEVRASAKEQQIVLDYLRAIKNTLEQHCTTIQTYGPIPFAIEKINHRYYAELHLTAHNKVSLHNELSLLQEIIQHFDKTNRFKTIIDVDAV